MNDEAKTKDKLIEEPTASLQREADLENREDQKDLARNYMRGTAINALLRLSLEDHSLEELLRKALDIILSIPSLSLESMGSIFLVEDKPEVLVMKVRKGIDEPLLKECGRVPFGTCLCGRAAVVKKIVFADHIDERHEIRYEGMAPHGHYCVPILLSGNAIGVINLYVKDGHRRVGREEEFLDSVANTLAGIIKRKQTEETLLRAEEKYRSIVENAQEGIYRTSPEGRFITVNRAMADMLGYDSPEEIIASFTDIAHQLYVNQEDRIKLRKLVEEHGPVKGFETQFYRKDGSRIWVSIHIRAVHDIHGRVLYYEGINEDITERKHAEELHALDEARLESLLKISQYESETIQDLLDFALDEAISLTGSALGYIYFYNDQKKEFTLNTWSKDVMKECAVAEPQTVYQLEKTGIWGEAVRQARPIVVNDFQAPHPLKKGYPEGHAPLYRYLTLPVFSADRIVAVVAVANKKTDYDESDIRQLTLLMDSVWKIAGKKRVEEALKEALYFQQQLIDALPIPIFYKDKEGRYLGCNKAFEQFFGQTREEITGKSVYDLSPKELADIYHERDLDLLQSQKIQIYESSVKDTGGVVHSVIFHKATFPDRDGSVGGLIGAILDITERMQAEKLYKALAENSLAAVFILQDDKFRFINTSAVAYAGYDVEELIGRSSETIVHPEDREMVYKKGLEMLRGKAAAPYEFRMVTKEGKIRWILQIISPIYYEGKRAILGNAIDITDIKQAEDNRIQSFEHLRKALGATVQAMAIAVETRDPYTAGHQRRVADLARSVASEMGLSSDQIDGLRMASMIHDIGKISVPAEILSKPTKLTDIEFSLIKVHVQSGYDILKDIEFPWSIARMVLEHHERMDGSGYPNGVTGENMLIESRILAVADVVEAIASHRPYRPGMGIAAALDEIIKNRGVIYDPDVVDACLKLFREKGYTLKV